MKRCHGRLHYDRKFKTFIFLIRYIYVKKGVFFLIISFQRERVNSEHDCYRFKIRSRKNYSETDNIMVYKSTHNDIHDSMKRYKSIYKTIVGTKDQSVKIGSIRS
jgi:hypothetical protein